MITPKMDIYNSNYRALDKPGKHSANPHKFVSNLSINSVTIFPGLKFSTERTYEKWIPTSKTNIRHRPGL